MTFIKICGITNIEDARLAAEAGADLLGFIFYAKSPRYVMPSQVRAIVQSLKSEGARVTTVGVFVNTTPQEVIDTLHISEVDVAQLSGDERVEDLAQLERRGYKAVRSAEQAQLVLQHRYARPSNSMLPDLLLDANHPQLYGGSGMQADESLAGTLARECRLLLAGGLKPENVVAAIEHVRPWGVDVSSGVEAAPGRKDPARVRAFIQAVRGADTRMATPPTG
jgi:phosphoribosylanthranilate isomerase